MSDIIVYADEIVDIQDDVHYTEMYNELSKYKTLSHSEIDWHKVYTNSLDLLKKSLDTRVFRGFILGVISINTNDVFIKLNEVINHYHALWSNVYKKYAEENSKQAKIQNKFFTDTLNELIEANNTYKVNIPTEIVLNINAVIDDFNNNLNTNFQLMIVPAKKEDKPSENISQNNTLSISTKSIESMDTREYREYFFSLGRKLLEKDILNIAGYSLFWEGVWGRITQEVPHKNNITAVRYPEHNTIEIIKNISEYTSGNIIRALSNLLLNPFWFEGYKIFIDYSNKVNQHTIASHIKSLACLQLTKFEWITKLHFSNNESFCSRSLYNFFNDNQPHYRVEVVTEPSKPVKHKKENLDTKSLKERLNIINNELDNSIKSRVNGLISLAETMHANGLDNSADILYIEVINLMETTLLKDYLIEEYTNIKEQQHIDK